MNTTRGGFIGSLIAAVATPAVLSSEPANNKVEPRPRHRALVMCDVNLIQHRDVYNIGRHLHEMGMDALVIAVDLDCKGDPIRILNIDNIPPETVESLIEKVREFANA